MRYLIEIALTISLLTALGDGQRQGSNCTMKHTGRVGVCTPFANCQSAEEAASKGNFPQKCDLTDDDSELVCCVAATCPPLLEGLVTQLPIGSKAADYCIELAEKIHPCQETDSGWTRGNICPYLTPDSNIEYTESLMTSAAENPHFGRFGRNQMGTMSWYYFPVTLVSDRWVLTSGYAIHVLNYNQDLFVGLGGTFTIDYYPDEIYKVTEVIIHPLFDKDSVTSYNDIALLRLDRRVIFTDRIIPACLHTGTPLPDSGFIQTKWGGLFSLHYKTTMERVSQKECSTLYTSAMQSHPAGVKHDLEICSRPVNKTERAGRWYEGSPLTLPNSLRVACTHLLVGLSSGTNIPFTGITNTRISAYIPWIEGIVWPKSDIVD